MLDSRQCFVEFDNGDYNKVKSFLVRQPLQSGPDQPYKLYVIKMSAETVETWYQVDVNLEESNVAKYNHTEVQNKYGFIPVRCV